MGHSVVPLLFLALIGAVWMESGLPAQGVAPWLLLWPLLPALCLYLRRWCAGALFLVLLGGAALGLRLARPAPHARLERYCWLVRWAEGRITARSPGKRSQTIRLELAVERIALVDGRILPVRGLALLYHKGAAGGDARWQPGARIRVEGELEGLPMNERWVSWRRFLLRRGVEGLFRSPIGLRLLAAEPALPRFLRRMRDRLVAGLAAGGGPLARFLPAVVLGERRGLTPEERDSFIRAGVIHLLAVSGLHVGLLCGLWYLLFRLFGIAPRWAGPGLLLLLPWYAALCGFTPSVVRAALMAGSFVLAGQVRGAASPWHALCTAGCLSLIIHPPILFTPGWQLSFAATAGILALAEAMYRGLRRRRLVPWLAGPLSVSLAAQAAVLPISAAFFGRISCISPLVNLLVMPLFLVAAGGGLLAAALLALTGWQAPFALANRITWLLQQVVGGAASLPFATLGFSGLPLPGNILYYLVLIVTIKGKTIAGTNRPAQSALTEALAGLFTQPRTQCQAGSGTKLFD